MTKPVIEDNDLLMNHPFIRQIVTQLRAVDSYGTYDTWTDARVLDPLILTRDRRRDIPLVGDPDETTITRIKAFYNAIASSIEAECGLMAVPLVNLTHEGFGRVILTVGRLVVVDRTLRDVHRFGFESLAKLVSEGEGAASKALALVNEFRTVAER